ncbi:Phage terminase large subunit [compost metagenome]
MFAVRGRPFGEKAIKDGAGQVDIDWRGKRLKKGVILWHVGTNLAKDLLHSRLAIEAPGAGYVHLSADLSDEWFRQFSGEVRVARKTATGTRTLWTAIRKRVETWDCAVYALWVAEHLGLSRKTDAWWDAMAAKLDALPPPAEHDDEANRSPKRTPTRPAHAAPAAPPAPQRAATRAGRRRAAPSSYLKGRR